MEVVLLGLGLTLVLGSLCGLAASMRIGALARRIAALEGRIGHIPVPPVVLGPPSEAKPIAPATAWEQLSATPVTAACVPPPEPRIPHRTSAPPAPPPPPPPPSDWWRAFELRAGTRWVTWLGAAALVVAAALFVKLAIDEGWLGPAARLALGGAAGVGLIGAGLRAHRAQMRPLAHGLFGAGIGVLYVSTYVAFASHGLIPRELAFGLMVTVTVTGCALAIGFDAQAVAVLALLGGLITPVAVASGDGSRDALFTYLAVLDLGVVAIAMVRRWRALELIAMAGTWVLFGGWLHRYHDPATWPAELVWLAGFHALFLALPFGFHLIRSIELPTGRFRTAIANAAAVSVFAAAITGGERHVLGVAALVMAAGYHALGAVARRRLAGDGRARFGFVALTVVFATSSVPLLLRDHGITLAWSLEAPVLLALGFHYRFFPIRLAGLGVLVLATANLVLHWNRHAVGALPFVNVAYASAMAVPLGAALFAVVHRALRRRGDGRDRWLGVIAAIGAAALALAITHAELDRWLIATGRAELSLAATAMLWAIGALVAAAAATGRTDRVAEVAAAAFAAFAARQAFLAYAVAGHPFGLALNLRFAGAVTTCLALAALARRVTRRDRDHAFLLWTTAIGGLGAAIGAEAYLHYAALDSAALDVARAGRRAQTALSIAWAGYAAALLAVGFARSHRPIRLAGLGLLGLVAAKLVVIDLAGAPPLYRVLSFLVLGALMIGASFAYHRLERRT